MSPLGTIRRGKNWARRLAVDSYQIAQSPLPRPMKNKILRTRWVLALMALFGRGGSKIKRYQILNHRITAYSFSTVLDLYRDIFVGLEYNFCSSKSAPFIIDCGSNIGMSIAFFKTLYPHCKLLGFEPSAQAFRLLQDNIERNGFNDVKIYPYALSAEERSMDFYSDATLPGSLSMSTIKERVPRATKTCVQGVKLSRYIDREVDFLKLDVEGAEGDVIAELAASGKLSQIVKMTIEYHHHIRKEEDRFSELLAHLERAGFGYQIGAVLSFDVRYDHGGTFQDVLVYAYRKRNS